jgi:uncharacterized membrane protein
MPKENLMFALMIDFTNLLLAALVVGAMFGVWLVFNPAGLDASFYVALHQQGIRTLNQRLPALGAATIVLTIAAAALGRVNAARFRLLTAAVVCFCGDRPNHTISESTNQRDRDDLERQFAAVQLD